MHPYRAPRPLPGTLAARPPPLPLPGPTAIATSLVLATGGVLLVAGALFRDDTNVALGLLLLFWVLLSR